MEIHPSAVVSSLAELGPGVRIGPYCTIGEHVVVGADTIIGAHVIIEGHTNIGERNRISPFSVIGTPPQDIGYRGEDTRVIIGNDNIFREYVSINRATTKEEWKTVIGSNNYLMAYSHVAHDCVLGDYIVMANAATLGGHIKVGDHSTLGGLSAVHQFVRLGSYSFLGGASGLVKDLPPFMIGAGSRAKLYGINQKGLSRGGFSREKIDALKRAYRILWKENKKFEEGVRQVQGEIDVFPELNILLKFFDGSKRGILR